MALGGLLVWGCVLCSRVFGWVCGLVSQRFVMALYGLLFVRYPRVIWAGP